MKPEPPAKSFLVSHPLVVIGIPCFNEAEWLYRTIESVQAQTHEDFGVLLSDNASEDSTGTIAKSIADVDKRFHHHRHAKNIGAASNFNFILDETESPFFLWLGAHDLLDPRFLEKHIEALQGNMQASLSQSAQTCIDEAGKPFETIKDRSLAGGKPDSVWRYLRSVRANQSNVGINTLIRRSALQGTRFTTLIGTDRIILSRIAYRGPFHDVGGALYLRRVFRDERGGWEGYLERLAGHSVAGPAQNWDGMAEAYDRDLRSLIGDGPRQRAARWLLQLILRYYLPVDRGSLTTILLWTVRRSLKRIWPPGKKRVS